jgi:tetratricopeptide (TPR) repeat protein
MGKSIQGAGGALVLGVVFQSVVNRTKIRKQDQFKSPERWLKECFLELHSVFESFDGSMLISVVMGIIDDQSGLVYYINAEHPWTVLYRDNIASFIENDLELRKIGTVGMDGDIRIKTLSLEPSDILFLGSDGRDDLVTSNDGNTRMINEDETQFLRRVEEGKGKVQDIVQGIKNYGEITDDLSLMKIEFQPVGPYPHKDPSDKKNRMEKIYSLYKEKKYSTVVEMAESFIHEYPEEIEVFHYAATAYKLLKNYNRAADLGEILKMRMPTHIDNLVNLSDNYRIMGNVDRARKILVKLEKYDTANKYLDEIRNKLSEVGGNPIFVG